MNRNIIGARWKAFSFPFKLPVKLCFLLFTSLSFCQVAEATHGLGADITYQCIGPNQYQVTLNFFRDCAGVSPSGSYSLSYSSATCGVNSSFTANQQGGPQDITPVCATEPTSCSGGGNYGVEQYTYVGTLNLPPGCGDDWVIGWSTCCRSDAINTLSNPGGQANYSQAFLDNTINPCNSSPVFNNPPSAIVCINQPVNYNHGAVDADGDSLVFSLGDCYEGAGDPVNYNAGYSGANPLSTSGGVNVNSQTGDVQFTPNSLEVAVLCVIVEEYRNGIKIGQVARDMQFTVLNCNNAPPVASGANGTADYTASLCEGGDICFDIDGSDPNGEDVEMTWNFGIPNGSFVITDNGTPAPVATFCWQATVDDVGPNFFTVSVEDDACPVTGNGTYTFQVDVLPSPNTLSAGADQGICEGGSVNLNATSNGALTYSWTPVTGLQNPNSQNPIATPAISTTYTCFATFADGCNRTDAVTITVNPTPSVNISPQVGYTCPGGSLILTASSTDPGTFNWSTGGGAATESVSPSGDTWYWVDLTDGNGCIDRDSAEVLVSQPQGDVCSIIYSSSNGSGDGTPSSPASLADALVMAACNNVVIKMAIGTYTIDNPISNITSNITLEGGYDPTDNWTKISVPGATRILRSNLNVQGPANAPRLVAIEINSQSNFRFQDLTIEVASPVVDGGTGTSLYGLYLNGCANYDIVRCQIITAQAEAGGTGTPGNQGQAGGDGGGGGIGQSCFCNASGGGGGGGGTAAWGGNPGGSGGGGGGGSVPFGGGDNGGSGASVTGANGGGGGGSMSDETFGGGCETPGPGNNGNNGQTGFVGSTGTLGNNGNDAFVGGFYVPGNGTGGSQGGIGGGGAGGGGGGGQGAIAGNADGGQGGGGGGSGGQGGTGGGGGFGAGGSFAVFLVSNGAGGGFTDCAIMPGAGGSAGQGGAGGPGGSGGQGGPGGFQACDSGNGGDGGDGGQGGTGGSGGLGSQGVSEQIHLESGNAANFIPLNLSAQPVLFMSDVNCTQTDIEYECNVNLTWDLGAGSTVGPTNPAPSSSLITQYTNTGRNDILIGADEYIGFGNILLDGQATPDVQTTAPLVNGQYTLCEGESASFSVVNGGVSYLYDWDFDGAITPDQYTGPQYDTLNNLVFNTPGVYNIEVTFTTLCCGMSPPGVIELHVDPQPDLNVSGLTEMCLGDPDGIDITAIGADIYDYQPVTGIFNLDGGNAYVKPTETITYLVTGSNLNGTCFDTETHTVTIYELDLTPFSSPSGCTPNGVAQVTASAGSGDYSYNWPSIPANTNSVNGLAVGTYQVFVTDNITGCVDSAAVNVQPDPSALVSWIANSQNVSCFGETDGSVTVATLNATGAPIFNWSPAQPDAGTLTNLAPGTYYVTITDQIGCETYDSVTISEPDLLQLVVDDAISPSCPTTPDGEIHINAFGGTGPFVYTWLSPPGQPNAADLVNIFVGNYVAEVADANGCRDTVSVDLDAVGMETVNLGNDTILCRGETLVLDATITDPNPVSYTWHNLATGPLFTADFTNSDGSDWYYVVAGNGICLSVDSIFIQFDVPPDVFLALGDTAFCEGDSIVFDVTNNGATYNWNNNASNTPTYTSLATETITVEVIRGECEVYDTVDVIRQLKPIVDLGPDSTICANDSMILLAGINELDAQFQWEGLSHVDSNLTVLTAGEYIVLVTDSFCAVSDSITVQVNFPNNVDLGPDQLLCPDATATLDAGIDEQAVVFAWTPVNLQPGDSIFTVDGPGEYIVEVTDDWCVFSDTVNFFTNGPGQIDIGPDSSVLCQGDTLFLDAGIDETDVVFAWNDGSTDSIFAVTVPGTYEVTITDSACVFSDTMFVSVNYPGEIDLGPDSVLCLGDTLWLDAGIMENDIMFQWNGGIPTTDSTFFIYEAGEYDLVVQDSFCLFYDTIVVGINGPNKVDLGPDQLICLAETLTLDPGINEPDLLYQWQDLSTNPTLSAIFPGTYSVTITDSNCVYADTMMLTVNGPNDVNLGPDVFLCPGEKLTLNAGIYEPLVTFEWQDGSTDSLFLVSEPGSYQVTITDDLCVFSDTIIVRYVTPADVYIGNDTFICAGDQVLLDAGVDDPLAGFVWQDGSTDSTLLVSAEGYYHVTVTDSSCIAVDTIYVNMYDPDVIDFGPDTTLCEGDLLFLDAFIPDAAATYEWHDGSTDNDFMVTSEGYYWVEITMETCTATEDINVFYDATPEVNLGPNQTICETGLIVLDATNTDPDITYEWSTGFTGPVLNVTNPGVYSVTVTNGKCSVVDVIDIIHDDYPGFTLGNDTSFCEGPNYILPPGGPTAEGDYQWSTGATSQTIPVTGSGGTFTLQITNGTCIFRDTVTVDIWPRPSADFDSDPLIGGCVTITDHSIDFYDVSDDGSSWEWSFGDGITSELQNPFHDYPANDTYYVELLIANDYGCEDSTEKCFILEVDLLIPNVFSPNEDGLFDEWMIKYGGATVDIMIFDRWGNLVFQTQDKFEGWNGKHYSTGQDCAEGVYYYKIQLEEEDKPRTGNITLLR